MLAVLYLLSLAGAGPDPSPKAGTSIVVAGQSFDVGRPVVLWRDPERGFDGYAPRCLEERARANNPCCASYEPHFRARPPEQRTLVELQRRLRLIVLHHDGCANSRTCFFLMHDGCQKRSAHFMIDNDGTIYQTLDVAEIAFHARLVNDVSIGIELCNLARVQSGRVPEEYARRPRRTVRIKGEEIDAFDFRPEQYESVAALTRTLLRIFPGIVAEVPLDEAGRPRLEFLSEPRQRSGIVGHVHVDDVAGKWDPGAFRWLDFLDALTGPFLPLEIDGFDRFPPANPARAEQVAQAAFAHAERGSIAQFPVQPGGLFHSGVILRGRSGAPVLAPAAGVILAARLAGREGTSTSFVLMRHDVELEGHDFSFFSLLYHLRPETLALARPPGWLQRLAERDASARLALEQGRTVLLNEPTTAGEPVGFLAERGRESGSGPSLRFEIFSRDPPPQGRFWRRVHVPGSGPFWGPALAGLLDRSGDLLTAADIRRQFGGGARPRGRARALRALAVEHVHEWSSRLGETVYQSAPELSALTPDERRRLYEAVAGPRLFLTPELARHAGLREDHVVHSYNPIAFLHWLSRRKGGGDLPPAGVPHRQTLRAPGLLTEAERRRTWLDYLDPPPADGPAPYYKRLVEIPVRVKRRLDIPLLDVAVGNHRDSEDR